MSEPLARLYDLALHALAEQDRRADALRGRLGPVLAAAALGVSLLSGPVTGGAHPTGVGGRLAIAVAICGLLLTIAGVARLVGVRRQAVDEIDPQRLTAELKREGLLDDEGNFYEAMIVRLGDRLDRRERANEQLVAAFTAMLWGILAMLCGLALAAIVG